MVLGINDDFIGGDAKEATEEYDCTDMTQGVFKAYVVFFQIYVHPYSVVEELLAPYNIIQGYINQRHKPNQPQMVSIPKIW